MKTRLLAGFTALVLGGLTSCSNILEENGIPNSVAESGMGELRINLTTDGSLNVGTKGGSEETTTPTSVQTSVKIKNNSYTLQEEDFNITVTPASGTEAETYTNKKVSDFPLTVKAGTYSVSVKYHEMQKSLAWDEPSFAGQTNNDTNATVSTTKPGTASIGATLDNSIITIDNETFNTFKGKVNIKKLFVYAGNTKPTSETEGTIFSLIDGSGSSVSLKTNQLLFVQKGATDIHIFIEYELGNEVKDHTSSIQSSTTNGKEYVVKYELIENAGKLNLLQITVDGNVTQEEVKVDVNPYDNNNNNTGV